MNKYYALYKELSKIENNGRKIGLFRTICSIFGGCFLSYLAMTLLVFLLPGTVGESLTVPIVFHTIVWAMCSLWISIALTKWIALMRVFVPSFIFSILLVIFYNL
ncbi:MAG: hypothetical protein HRT41_09720 [Campylobacteraceae bacterium]|nr:hypothetical protein [Campylobacteraceae bacterium]